MPGYETGFATTCHIRFLLGSARNGGGIKKAAGRKIRAAFYINNV